MWEILVNLIYYCQLQSPIVFSTWLRRNIYIFYHMIWMLIIFWSVATSKQDNVISAPKTNMPRCLFGNWFTVWSHTFCLHQCIFSCPCIWESYSNRFREIYCSPQEWTKFIETVCYRRKTREIHGYFTTTTKWIRARFHNPSWWISNLNFRWKFKI